MSWIGFDIGGANLKAADGRGWSQCVPFELWKNPVGLANALNTLVGMAPPTNRIAVTMTGELCDCFATKAEGVRHILAAVESVAGASDTLVYLVDGRLVSIAAAHELPQLAAASNWHALAKFAGRFVPRGAGLLIDIGSTTTDIIPLTGGRPCARGLNDTQRLVDGELVYTGVGRTPVCAITRWLPWRGERCPVAAELFATAADAYVVLGWVAEQADATTTADGRPLAKEFATARLARMICADSGDFEVDDARRAAECVRDAQLAELERALRQVIERLGQAPQAVVISGSGEFLAKMVVEKVLARVEVISLADRLGPAAAISGAAHAVAILANEAPAQ